MKKAIDDFDPAAKDKAQKEKDNADKDVLIKDQAKRDAETELEKAKKTDKTREAKKSQERQNKADKEADKTAKEGEVKDADKAVKDAEEKLKTAQYPTDVVLTPEWRDKAKELIHKYKESYPEPYPDLTGMDLDQIDKPGQAGDQNVKPVGPAPSYQAPAVLSPVQEEAGQKALPNTGSQVSLLALLGYGFLAGLRIILKKKEG